MAGNFRFTIITFCLMHFALFLNISILLSSSFLGHFYRIKMIFPPSAVLHHTTYVIRKMMAQGRLTFIIGV
jgi:hypothetical protein